jgi:hypothetical protein
VVRLRAHSNTRLQGRFTVGGLLPFPWSGQACWPSGYCSMSLVSASFWHAAGTERPPDANCRLGAAHVLRAEHDFGARGAAEPLSAGWVPALGLACMPVAQLDPAHGARLFKCDRSCWKSGLRSARFTNAHHRRPSGPPPQKMAADPVRCVSQAMPVRTAALLRHISIMHLLSDWPISQEPSGFCRAGSVKRRRSRSRRDAVGALDRFRETPIIPGGGLGSALLPKPGRRHLGSPHG